MLCWIIFSFSKSGNVFFLKKKEFWQNFAPIFFANADCESMVGNTIVMWFNCGEQWCHVLEEALVGQPIRLPPVGNKCLTLLGSNTFAGGREGACSIVHNCLDCPIETVVFSFFPKCNSQPPTSSTLCCQVQFQHEWTLMNASEVWINSGGIGYVFKQASEEPPYHLTEQQLALPGSSHSCITAHLHST